MIPLIQRQDPDPFYPSLLIPRLFVHGAFEPWVLPLDGQTAFSGAFVDTGAPYVIIPYKTHRTGKIKIYQDLGPQPYRLTSMGGAPLLQPMAEVGVCFLAQIPGGYEYRPASFAVVKAFLLAKQVRPKERVVIGLDAMRTHFPLYANGARAFFLEAGESTQVP
ncbi:MAG: hypothetical protein L0Z62_27315 [Gemmataceae bacterium]|nr:hypothetical protein [Gemmataceae bacterium]